MALDGWHFKAIGTQHGFAYLISDSEQAIDAIVEMLTDQGAEYVEMDPAEQN